MSEAEYNDLVRNAAAKWPVVVRALQKKHFGAEPMAIEDAVENAMISFSDRDKIMNIHHPEKPFLWLVSTAEHLYQHELRKNTKLIPIDKLSIEPPMPDKGIESFEANEASEKLFTKLKKRYSDIIKAIDWEGLTFVRLRRERVNHAKRYTTVTRTQRKKRKKLPKNWACYPPPPWQ